MKPYLILNTAARLVTMVALSISLAGIAHAQNNTSAEKKPNPSTSSQYRSDRPCGGPNDLKCPGGTICVDDPSDQCDPTQDGIKCMGFCVAGTTTGSVKQPCAGPNGLRCPGGMNCVDDPTDKCDPTQDGDKCMGYCAAGAQMPIKPPCGGPSSLKCPGGTICVDDPSDKCDPTQDGIQCKGFCEAHPK